VITAWGTSAWAAGGEVAGAVLTAAALFYAFWQRHRDEQRRRDDAASMAQSAKRSEAAKVNAWLEAERAIDEGQRPIRWWLVVSNVGSTPVYDWEAAVWWTWALSDQHKSERLTVTLHNTSSGTLVPGAPVRLLAAREADPWFPALTTLSARVGVVWQALEGTYWFRVGGELRSSSHRWPLPWSGDDRDPDGLVQHIIKNQQR
jgi:hypothetical protein